MIKPSAELGERARVRVVACQAQFDARLNLATTHLLVGDLIAASDHAKAAAEYESPPNRVRLPVVLGVSRLRQDIHADVRETLISAVSAAEAQLERTPRDYKAFDAKALALCALTLVGGQDHIAQANDSFRAARAITTAPGIVARTLALLDALSPVDRAGLLAPARAAAAGTGPQ